MIESLIGKGYAYAAGGDVYFDVSKKTDYGKLSGQKVDEMRSGARIEVGEAKKSPLDFALWKGSKPGEVSRTLKVITDIKDEGEIEFRAKGNVVP